MKKYLPIGDEKGEHHKVVLRDTFYQKTSGCVESNWHASREGKRHPNLKLFTRDGITIMIQMKNSLIPYDRSNAQKHAVAESRAHERGAYIMNDLRNLVNSTKVINNGSQLAYERFDKATRKVTWVPFLAYEDYYEAAIAILEQNPSMNWKDFYSLMSQLYHMNVKILRELPYKGKSERDLYSRMSRLDYVNAQQLTELFFFYR